MKGREGCPPSVRLRRDTRRAEVLPAEAPAKAGGGDGRIQIGQVGVPEMAAPQRFEKTSRGVKGFRYPFLDGYPKSRYPFVLENWSLKTGSRTGTATRF